MPLRSILKDFICHVENLEKRRLFGDNPYDREFQRLKELTDRLKNDPGYTCKIGQLEANRRKNRYKDILPYDRTRVILQEYNDEPNSDYINASYIKGSSGSMAYIAAQGPLPHTVNDFWRMVWQCEVQVVVMACSEREGGKTKCDYYWPGLGERKVYQDIVIETVKAKAICEDFLVRTWKLVRGGEERTVCQFHYMTWPDHGIPSSVNPILHMIRLIRNCQATETIPILVHCSAGCGRTGTFCAIDQVWSLLRSGKLQSMFSLFKMVSEMRHQRVAMVQTKEQFMLVHRAVATLFQQQLSIIDSHPYQNINLLGEPIAVLEDVHIYENVDSLQSIFQVKNNARINQVNKPPMKHANRLDTPPSSGTETDHSEEEFDAYEAVYAPRLSQSENFESKKCVTLPPKHYEHANQLPLPTKRQSDKLVTSQEEERIMKLLSELNKDNSRNSQNIFKPKCNRTGSQDDINVTYSPERSFVYLSDSDNSDEEIHFKPEIVKKPSIEKLRSLFENSNPRLERKPSDGRREITRSHSQRVARSNVPGSNAQFFVPIMKSDTFNAFDHKHKPRFQPRNDQVYGNISNEAGCCDTLPNQVSVERPELPKKQRDIHKQRVNYVKEKVFVSSNNVVPKSILHKNEYTSTGSRKPPVLPRKKFIGSRISGADTLDSALSDKPTSTPEHARDLNIEDEAESFHGSGWSTFYGPCVPSLNYKSQSNYKSKEGELSKDDIKPNRKAQYTNVNLQAKNNIEKIEAAIEQFPRGAIIDLTSTIKKAPVLPVENQEALKISEEKSSFEEGENTNFYDSKVMPKKTNIGYEKIWLGTASKVTEPSEEQNDLHVEKVMCLTSENNYGKITPRCKSEEKLMDLEYSNAVSGSTNKGNGYGRIMFKSSSEPPVVANQSTDSTSSKDDTFSSSDSSNSSSNLRLKTAVPNLLIHSPVTRRKMQESSEKVLLKDNTPEPEFNSAVAEIRNLIDELMLNPNGATAPEPPKRERCHSLDLLTVDSNVPSENRGRRPSTDLLEDYQPQLSPRNKASYPVEKSSSSSNNSAISKDGVFYSDNLQAGPSLVDNPVHHSNKSFYNGRSTDSTWTTSNWSDKLRDFSNVSPNTKAANQRTYDNATNVSSSNVVHESNMRKPRTNITRSVSAREASRPIVIKRNVDLKYGNSSNLKCATMKHNICNDGAQSVLKKQYELDPSSIKDDGYVTLSETFGQHSRVARSPDNHKGEQNNMPSPSISKSTHHQGDHHLYATIQHNSSDQSRNDRVAFRTLPQPPTPSHDSQSNKHQNKLQIDEHVYCLPTPPKYRPPPLPPQQIRNTSNPDLPTPPPSSEETSSSSSQSDTRSEPLYSQIQKPRKELPQFSLSESLASAGYGHILTKPPNISHDDLDVNDKPIAPPRKGRRQNKFSRHSLLDIESKKYSLNEDNPHEKFNSQWNTLHDATDIEIDSDRTESAPHIPQKTAAAFQLPDEGEEDISEDSPSSSASLNSSIGSGTNMKLDDSHGSIFSRSISKAFGKLNLFNRSNGKQQDLTQTSENTNTNESLAQTSPRIKRSDGSSKTQGSSGLGFPNRLSKNLKNSCSIPQS